MNWREKLAALYKEARALAEKSEKGDLTEADEARWTAIKPEIEEARGKVEEEEQRAKDAAEFRAGDQHYNQSNGRRVSGIVPGDQENRAQSNGAEQRGSLSPSDQFLLSDEYKEWRARYSSPNAVGTTNPVVVGSLYGQQPVELDERGNLTGPQESRAAGLIYTGGGAFPSGLMTPQRVPGFFVPDRPELNVRDAFLNGQATGDTIEFFRETSFTNSAAFVAEATATSPTTLGQSGVKPESGFVLERATTTIEILAHWMAVTNKALQDAPQVRTLIDGYLMTGLAEVEDEALINGNGTTPNIRGLLNTTGIQVMDNAYYSANAVNDAGTDNEDYNRILAARQAVRYVGRARATFVFLHPADHERFLTSTDANRQYMAGGPFTNADGISRLWGLRVIETEAMDEFEFVVGDGRKAAVWDRMAATISVGLINDQFIRNMQTILAEERVGFAVYRPPAFVHGELAGHA
jgi:HK97 family phage major capsid protein